MPDDKEQKDRLLIRPSAVPGDREYERARAQSGIPFKPSNPPEDQSSGEAEKRTGYNQARLTAKTEVVQMTPQLLRDYKDRLKNEIDARQIYGIWVFILVVVWLTVITNIIWSSGRKDIEPDATVLVALTTGATISVIGLLETIITYFFTKSNEQISLYKELFKAMIDEEKDG